MEKKKKSKIVFPSDYNLPQKQKTLVEKRKLYLPRPLYVLFCNAVPFL
jgi:hypothetical protein